MVLATLAAAATTIAPPAVAKTLSQQRQYVLNAPEQDLQAIGQHLMFGYHALWQLRPLMERGALGGIFVTDHNARAFKTPDTLQQHIAELRELAKAKLPRPLWVAVDQEGGLVSRLSPPLPRPISLQNLIGSPAVAMSGSRDKTVQTFSIEKAKALAILGVNINFSPVVDLRPNRRLKRDRYTVLRRRAISADPDTIGEVATDYCAALIAHGVLCTLKHFPGLAEVPADTHIRGAKLTKQTEALAEQDWRPFRHVLSQTDAAIMVGHPLLSEVDAKYPASTSKAAISGILREQWGFDGLVITDDFYMGAIRKRRGGMGKAAVDALNAGSDIVLISRDASELYPVIYKVLKAYQDGKLDKQMLAASRKRLDAAIQRIEEAQTATLIPELPGLADAAAGAPELEIVPPAPQETSRNPNIQLRKTLE
ncbi:MAG: glycoside hydrolase family 3 N-terminal domain-containing protein [Pseudomonadota bacterium]